MTGEYALQTHFASALSEAPATQTVVHPGCARDSPGDPSFSDSGQCQRQGTLGLRMTIAVDDLAILDHHGEMLAAL